MFIIIIIFLSLVLIISAIIGFTEERDALAVAFICGLAIWGVVEHFDYSEDFNKKIPKSELEIAIMDEVAIIRYGGRTFEYNSVREYKAIKEGVYAFTYIQNYDVLGEFNGRDYELIIKPKKLKDLVCD